MVIVFLLRCDGEKQKGARKMMVVLVADPVLDNSYRQEADRTAFDIRHCLAQALGVWPIVHLSRGPTHALELLKKNEYNLIFVLASDSKDKKNRDYNLFSFLRESKVPAIFVGRANGIRDAGIYGAHLALPLTWTGVLRAVYHVAERAFENLELVRES